MSLDESVRQEITDTIETNEVVLFMKGNRRSPQCGFSATVVEILDRGPGVSKAVSDRLFEPFVSGRRGGIGLGLALSRRIVDLHGGRLELGARPGGGTIASLSIGLSQEPTSGSISDGTSETPRDPDS